VEASPFCRRGIGAFGEHVALPPDATSSHEKSTWSHKGPLVQTFFRRALRSEACDGSRSANNFVGWANRPTKYPPDPARFPIDTSLALPAWWRARHPLFPPDGYRRAHTKPPGLSHPTERSALRPCLRQRSNFATPTLSEPNYSWPACTGIVVTLTTSGHRRHRNKQCGPSFHDRWGGTSGAMQVILIQVRAVPPHRAPLAFYFAVD